MPSYFVFSNDPKEFLKNIDRLPDVLIPIVYSYIPILVTMFLTKKNYIENHLLIRNVINKKYLEEYIRYMMRQDNDFVFKLLLVENVEKWLNMKKYYYKECIYGNYLHFLKSYAIDNQSVKCQLLIENLLLSKNQHKKKPNRYIRWKP